MTLIAKADRAYVALRDLLDEIHRLDPDAWCLEDKLHDALERVVEIGESEAEASAQAEAARPREATRE